MKNKKTLITLSALALMAVVVSPIGVKADQEGKKVGLDVNTNIHANLQINREDLGENNSERDGGRTLASTTLNSSTTISGRLPKGIENAPGIEKRIDDGKGLPSGIMKFFNDFFSRFTRHGTTTVAVALNIRDLHVAKATSTASVTWTTSESASSEVRYSTSSSVTASSTTVSDGTLSTSHTMTLTGLTPDTTYYYVVVAKDNSGNEKDTSVLQFKTEALATVDTVPPNILFSTTFGVNRNSAHIIWITNERSDSKVWLSTSSPVSVSATTTDSVASLSYFHNIVVSGLATSTTYFYAVSSTDASGNVSATSTGSFTTSNS